MVFGFTKNRKSIEVRQTMARFINRTLSGSLHTMQAVDEMRSESRHARLFTLLFVPVLETEDDLVANLAPGISQDVSSEGFSMVSRGQIPTDSILAIITDSVEMALLHCEVRHSRHIGYDHYLNGIKVLEKLRWTPFAKLRDAAQKCNSMYGKNNLELVS